MHRENEQFGNRAIEQEELRLTLPSKIRPEKMRIRANFGLIIKEQAEATKRIAKIAEIAKDRRN